MTRAELARVAKYLESDIVRAQVQKIRQVTANSVVVECRAPGKTIRLLFSVHPRFPRTVPLPDKPLHTVAAGSFCLLLRKRLAGGRVAELGVDPRDRVVTLNVSRTGQNGEEIWTLVAELFGPKSNLFLLDPNGNVVEALASKRLKSRRLAVGESYQPAPPPATAQDRDRGFEPGEMARLFDEAEAAWERQTRANTLRSALTREQKRLRKYLQRLRDELAGLPDPEELRRQADLLLLHLSELKKGQNEAKLPDITQPEAPLVRIELDPTKTPQGNAEAMFKTARKTRRKKERLFGRIEEMETRHHLFDGLEKQLDSAESEEGLAETAERMAAAGIKIARPKTAVKKAKKRKEGATPFVAQDGARIYVGRNAKENDEFTFRLARGNDFWLHVEGGQGSHVIVKLPSKAELASETLLDAASLALLHSSFKSAGAGNVMYTRCKHVKRPKGAPAGRVLAGSTKTLFVRLDDQRITRLYDSRDEQNGA